MITRQQKKKWTIVGLAMIIGVILILVGVIKMDDLPDIVGGIIIAAGSILFFGGLIMLLGGNE